MAKRNLPPDHFLLRDDPGDGVAEIDALDPVGCNPAIGNCFLNRSQRHAA